jgi:hypothetical protein
MHHSEYAIRLLAEQRSAELIAEAERQNQLHGLSHRQRRTRLRSLLARFRGRRPAPSKTVIDLREEPTPSPAPEAEVATGRGRAAQAALRPMARRR